MNIVTYKPIATQRPLNGQFCDQPLLGNNSVNNGRCWAIPTTVTLATMEEKRNDVFSVVLVTKHWWTVCSCRSFLEFINEKIYRTGDSVEADKNSSTVISASRRRRRKGHPVVSDETVMYGWVLCDSDHWQLALQITDPSSHQRGRPKTKSK
jgi:hypothetical protein